MKSLKFLLLLLVVFSCNTKKNTDFNSTADTNPAGQDNNHSKSITYQNPVLPGDFADPSVVRVGNDYWATATSSEWAPLYPVLHSTNLVDWKIVGHVFPDKAPAWADEHFWAPEISYEKGKYYIYYTAKKKGGNLCVGVASATKPTGPYTDHGPLVCQEVGSIDGFAIRDEKDDLYLIWKEDGNSVKKPTPIWGQRLNEAHTALEGEKFELFRNDSSSWEGGLVEGPFILKRNNYYYAFYAGDACCGRGCTYGVGVARSKSLRGPWIKYASNPILKQNETWKCAGHGSVVTDAKGRDFFLYHAYNTDGFVYPGRQGLLDEITWGADGWPRFSKNTPSAAAPAPHNLNAPDSINLTDEFTQAKLSQSWQWPVNKRPQYTLQAANKGQLTLQASPEAIGTVLAQRTLTDEYTVTTALNQSGLAPGLKAGISVIGDQNNAVGLSTSKAELILWSVKNNKYTVLAKSPAPKPTLIQLKLTATDGHKMQFAWSADGTQWNPLNNGQPVDASYLPPWDRGVRVGFTAKGPATASATFDWFKLVNTTSTAGK